MARSGLFLDDSDVKLSTDGNIVPLTGHIRTRAEHDAVVDAAWVPPSSTSTTP